MNFWIAKECLLVECLLVEHSTWPTYIYLRYTVGRRLVLALVPGSAACCGEGEAISDGIREEGL